jgi:hypothetical protein
VDGFPDVFSLIVLAPTEALIHLIVSIAGLI